MPKKCDIKPLLRLVSEMNVMNSSLQCLFLSTDHEGSLCRKGRVRCDETLLSPHTQDNKAENTFSVSVL